MGVVDLAEMLVALYCNHMLYLALFSQMIDLCISNVWLFYRRNCKEVKTHLDNLKEFIFKIAEKLMAKGRNYLTDLSSSNKVVKKSRKLVDNDLRYDC